jgi:hypothetical protein
MPDEVKDELDVMACNEGSKRLVWVKLQCWETCQGL